MVKQGISFHSNMKDTVEDFHYGVRQTRSGYHGAMDQGMISEHGFNHMLDCVIAMKEVLGDKVSLALDCGPGWMLPDAIRFARAVEKYNIMWLEDMLTGDYVPWVNPQAYRELTLSTSTPIHTGEQIYLRHNFKELIETQAVRIIGPDPADIGGIAELKWVAEHAYMHSILMAPHGTANGLLGLGALINVCATLPANYIAFEYPTASDPWWDDIIQGLPAGRIVKDSMVDLLPDRALASTSTPNRPSAISQMRMPGSSTDGVSVSPSSRKHSGTCPTPGEGRPPLPSLWREDRALGWRMRPPPTPQGMRPAHARVLQIAAHAPTHGPDSCARVVCRDRAHPPIGFRELPGHRRPPRSPYWSS